MKKYSKNAGQRVNDNKEIEAIAQQAHGVHLLGGSGLSQGDGQPVRPESMDDRETNQREEGAWHDHHSGR